MSDRGIKKWAPYKTLSEQDFNMAKQKEKEQKVEKPTISSEFAEEINNILVNYHGEELTIGYYRNGKVLEITDCIKKIDPYEKKLVLCSRKIIMINEIVSIIRKDEGEEL